MGSATAIMASMILVVDKAEMTSLLHKEHAFSDRFIAHMLARNIRIEQDLIDQLFNSSEKRLARTLLLLARYGMHDSPVRAVPPISQETLAEMVGTPAAGSVHLAHARPQRAHRAGPDQSALQLR